MRDRFDRIACSLAGAQLEQARNEQQRHEHRYRVIVDGAAGAKRRPRAGDEGAADTERNGHVHAEPEKADVAPRAGEEGYCRIHHDR